MRAIQESTTTAIPTNPSTNTRFALIICATHNVVHIPHKPGHYDQGHVHHNESNKAEPC